MRPVGGSWLPVLALCALVAGCARSTPIPDPLPELRSAFPLKMPLDRPRFLGTRGDVIAELAFGPDELLADTQFSNVIYTFL